MRVGTSNFRTVTEAVAYYLGQGHEDARESVNVKLAEGEISIGEPSSLREGESFSWDRDGRGQITVSF